MTEAQLIKRCIRENRSAQEELFKKHQGKLMGVALRYSNSKQEAQDVLQEAFIKIFNNISKYKSTGSFEGWMRRIVVNTALSSWDKRLLKHEPGNLDDSPDIEVDDQIVEKLSARNILSIIQGLPVGYRTIFCMYAVDGYSHKEISQHLNISESTSRTQYLRARKNLQEKVLRFG